MSQVRANSITNAAGTGAPDFPNGIEVSGGNVGIGTSFPAYMLDVAGDARINGKTVGRGGGNESSNLAFGEGALAVNAGGIVNIAIGNSCLFQNTTGGFNIGIGNNNLYDNTEGNSNIAIGWSSLSNNTGSSNICIGDSAGQNLTTGSNNTIIGAVYATAGLSDTIIIAAGSQERIRVDSSGNVGIGTSSPGQRLDVSGTARVTSFGVGTAASGTTGEIRATNNITAYYSDDRLKTRLGGIDDALGKVMSLSGFYYEANETAQALGYEVKQEVGVSAQEVQAVMPEVVAPAPIDAQYLTVRYERLVPLLIEAIKAQQAQIDDLKSKLGA